MLQEEVRQSTYRSPTIVVCLSIEVASVQCKKPSDLVAAVDQPSRLTNVSTAKACKKLSLLDDVEVFARHRRERCVDIFLETNTLLRSLLQICSDRLR